MVITWVITPIYTIFLVGYIIINWPFTKFLGHPKYKISKTKHHQKIPVPLHVACVFFDLPGNPTLLSRDPWKGPAIWPPVPRWCWVESTNPKLNFLEPRSCVELAFTTNKWPNPSKRTGSLGLVFSGISGQRSGNWFGIVSSPSANFSPHKSSWQGSATLFSTVEIKGPLKWICPAIFGQKRPTHCKESCIGQNLNEIWWLCWSKDPKVQLNNCQDSWFICWWHVCGVNHRTLQTQKAMNQQKQTHTHNSYRTMRHFDRVLAGRHAFHQRFQTPVPLLALHIRIHLEAGHWHIPLQAPNATNGNLYRSMDGCPNAGRPTYGTQMLIVYTIYLHEWLESMVNVGKYTLHG